MPRTLHLYIEPGRVPDHPALQAAVNALKLGLTVDRGYAPHETEGYLPCTLEGEDAGVDLRFEAGVAAPPGAGAPAGASTRVQLRWGGDPREHLAALALAGALARCAGACVVDPDTQTVQESDILLAQARRLHQDQF